MPGVFFFCCCPYWLVCFLDASRVAVSRAVAASVVAFLHVLSLDDVLIA